MNASRAEYAQHPTDEELVEYEFMQSRVLPRMYNVMTALLDLSTKTCTINW